MKQAIRDGVMTIYDDSLSERGLVENIKKLQVVFARQPKEFFNVLTERIIANGFTDKRLTDAVNHVIDNFEYKELNVSDIIKFDKKVKLYNHSEATYMITSGKATSFEDFDKITINGTLFRYLKSDKAKL